MKRIPRILLYILFHGLLMNLSAQAKKGAEFCLLWYNPENLFYPEDDSLPGDDSFTPEGLHHWTWSRYRQKITALAKVIIAAGGGEAPDLVGLCEVENARVLEDLVTHPILSPYRYSYFHQEGQDHRGMELACLVRTGRVKTLLWESIPFREPVFATRDMMHLTLSRGADTLDLFLVHLLSKYRGAGATALLRRAQAGQLQCCLDSVYRVRSRALLMAAGDFNDEFGSYSMEPLRFARFDGDSLSSLKPENGGSTYKYRGRWTLIDQVLVNTSLRSRILSVNTLQLSPLLTEDRQYGGLKPNRSYEGYQYRGGISDHLPLVVHLSFFPAFGPGGQ
jgi:endonuclease/exonuclease/phosphatase family metal-dependent hydrolase